MPLPLPPTRRIELFVALVVVLGVFGTGVYDFFNGRPPGRLGLDLAPGLALFIFGCAATFATSVVLARRSAATAGVLVALIVVSLSCSVVADPTYSSLLVAMPLLEIRRRGDAQWKTPLTALVLAIIAGLVLTETAPPATNEFETRFALAITFLMVVLLGDALGEGDRRVATEAEVARLTERARITEDIHDSLGHHLLAASVQLETARALRSGPADGSAVAIDNAASAVAQAISETRLIVDFGRKDGHMVVEPSIQDLARRIVPDDTSVSIDLEGNHSSLPPESQVAIYRFVQEALTNLVRHSAASAASVNSRATEASIIVEVSDNGGGFDPESVTDSGGLSNMRRRVEAIGGDFAVRSDAEGTAVVATVPR